MKKIILTIFLLSSIFVRSQYKIVEEIKYDSDLKTNYSNIMYLNLKDKVIDPVVYVYVFVDVYYQNNFRNEIKKNIAKNKLKNSVFYFVKSPSYCKDDSEKELFFLNFMCEILGRKKLIDSDLIIISNKNITAGYEAERLRKLEFNKNALKLNFSESKLCHSYLNEINKLVINPSINEIYNLITNKKHED